MSMEATRQQTLLKIEDVSLAFDNFLVLRNVNVEIKNIVRPGLSQGQVVGFLGPSGRGKTQLFRMMAGLQSPTSGRILVDQKGVLTPVEVGMVGVVDQHYTLFEHRIVGDNLMIAGNLAGLTKKDSEEKARSLLKRFQLEDRWRAYPGNLSGGQRQRVAIVQQLMSARGFLLMDEPFSGLDPNMKEEACELIMEVAAMDELFTIIVITHDVSSAMKISDTLWLLGFDRQISGTPIAGARIQEEIDLVSLGLAWDKLSEHKTEFRDLNARIIERFKTL